MKPKSSYKYESDSDESDGQHRYKHKKKKGEVVPRFIKNQIEQIDTDVIVINISKTQYDVVEEVAIELGWEIETSTKSQKWDLMWIDSHIEAHDLFKLNEHQKISHFPSIYVLTRKNFLGRSLMKMSKMFPKQYNFFPSTWAIPSDLTELMRYDEKLTQKNIYIFKPEAQAQGKGIKINEKVEEFQGKVGIVQVYINNPLLIENLKFDLRIYVLIMGFDPLRIFIYDEGLGRFATAKYQKAKKKNMNDVYMHLTNYSINKNHKNFIFNRNTKDMGKGHKRSLTAIYNYLQAVGLDVTLIKKKIDQLIIKTLIVGQPMIAHTYGLAQADNNANDFCFQILGFDILINQQEEPILLEVNHTPSFHTDTPLDHQIKKNLIKDTLNLLNVNTDRKKQKISQKRQFMELRSQRKLVKLTPEEKEANRIQKQKERDQYQLNNLGNFRKIFPTQNMSPFHSMIEYANKIFLEQYGLKSKPNRTLNQTNAPVSSQKQFIPNKQRPIESIGTVALKAKRQLSKKSRFPSLSYARSRNYSVNMNVDKKGKQLLNGEHVCYLSFSGDHLRDSTEKQKGNFLAPKLLEINEVNEKYGFQKLSKVKNSNSFMITENKKKAKIGKSSEEMIAEMDNAFPMCKQLNYEAVINTLNKMKNEHKLASKLLPRKN